MTTASPRTADRPLRILRRRDLVVQPLAGQLEPHWGVKDPLAQRYYQLNEHEYWLFTRLDGAHSLQELRRDFEAQFPGARLHAETIQQFLVRLHDAGLVTSTAAGQGAVLHERRQQQQREQRWLRLAAPWQVRWRGLDPDRWLNVVAPWLKPLWSPVALAGYAALLLSALLLVTVQWEHTLARLPSWTELWRPSQLGLFIAAIACTKVLHEWGHALACKHFGGECHELGLIFVWGVPCLYCDVTDAWLLPKHARIITSAAGMAVELLIAAVATWVWWFTWPGVIHDLALALMLTNGLNTLLVNGNPLLRYDGYYVLSDWLERPNLREEAQFACRRWLGRLLLGNHRRQSPASSLAEWSLITYAAGSTVYATFVLALTLWALRQFAQPVGLSPLVTALSGLTVVGMLASPTAELVQTLRHPVRQTPWLRWRPWLVASGICGAGMLLLMLPLPRSIVVLAVAEPAESQAVYVTVPGRIVSAKTDRVSAGDVIAQLENDELQRDLLQLQALHDRQQALVALLKRRQVREPLAADELPVAERGLADLAERLARRQQDRERLTLRAPLAGAVLPAAYRTFQPCAADELPTWTHDPLAIENRGAWLEAGTIVALVGDELWRDVLLLIDQADVGSLRMGQPVQVLFEQLGGQLLSGELREIAERHAGQLPEEFASVIELPHGGDSPQTSNSSAHHYFARVQLRGEVPPLTIGARGTAKLHLPLESLGSRLLRWWHATVRFE